MDRVLSAGAAARIRLYQDSDHLWEWAAEPRQSWLIQDRIALAGGKLERFHKSIEEEMHHCESLSEYIEYYNERRLYFSPDMHNYKTPLKVFSAKKATKAIRANDP